MEYTNNYHIYVKKSSFTELQISLKFSKFFVGGKKNTKSTLCNFGMTFCISSNFGGGSFYE